MNRNPIIPFVLIMAFGVLAMFLLSFKGLGDMKELAAEEEGGEKTEEVASNPEDIYKQSCLACHGGDYTGGIGPSLVGVGDKLSTEEIANILVNGQGTMPPNLVSADKAPAMAEWLAEIK